MPLQITYDNGTTELVSVDAVLTWRDWSVREAGKILAVAQGELRRFSTDRDGLACDIERRK